MASPNYPNHIILQLHEYLDIDLATYTYLSVLLFFPSEIRRDQWVARGVSGLSPSTWKPSLASWHGNKSYRATCFIGQPTSLIDIRTSRRTIPFCHRSYGNLRHSKRSRLDSSIFHKHFLQISLAETNKKVDMDQQNNREVLAVFFCLHPRSAIDVRS